MGGRGHGGPPRHARKQGLGTIPLPRPHPPSRPLPQPQELVYAWAIPAPQLPGDVQYIKGGGEGGVEVGGVWLMVAVLGVGGP